MVDICEFLETMFAEDEWWARNAGGYFNNTPPATGEHWQWVESENDTVIVPDPVAGEQLDEQGPGDWCRLSLRSVDKYPVDGASYTLPSFIIGTAEEVNTVGAGHIVRHNPARVLRDVEAKRRLLKECAWTADCGKPDSAVVGLAEIVMKELAAPYSGHPAYALIVRHGAGGLTGAPSVNESEETP
jgi:hypothetical protein